MNKWIWIAVPAVPLLLGTTALATTPDKSEEQFVDSSTQENAEGPRQESVEGTTTTTEANPESSDTTTTAAEVQSANGPDAGVSNSATEDDSLPTTTTTTTSTTPTTSPAPTSTAPTTTTPDAIDWVRVERCYWSANEPNPGQFENLSIWQALGGTGTPADASQATRIEMVQKLHQEQPRIIEPCM